MTLNIGNVVDGSGFYTHQYHSTIKVSQGLIFAQPSTWRLITISFTITVALH